MIKKLNILLLAVIALLFFLAPGTAAEYTYPTIVLDGRPLSIAVPAIDEHGRTLVPVREFFTELDAVVNWDQDSQTVTVAEADKEIKITIGQSTAAVNGQAVELDTPPRVIDGRIMAPLRFVVEAIGASAIWNAETREINIQTAPTSSQAPNLPVVPGSSPATPSAPSPGDDKPLAIDLLNPQLTRYILVPLLLVGVLAGAILVRRSRTNSAHKQDDSGEAAASSEAEPNDNTHNEAEGAEISHLTVAHDDAEKSEDKYLGAIHDTAATADAIDHIGTSDTGSSSETVQSSDTHDEAKTAEADQPAETFAAMDSSEAGQPGETHAAVDSSEAGPPSETHAAVDSSEAGQPGETHAAVDPADADAHCQTRDDRETVEAYYHRGIQMLQQQNWTDARLALVYPSVLKYRDSEELGYYIEAQEQYQESQNPAATDPYWAAVMADYYCRKIPDDYEGSFKKEIAELKILCKNTLALHMQNLPM